MQKHLSLHDLRDDSSLPLLIRQIRESMLRLIEREIKADGVEINYSQHLVVKILAKTGPQMPGDLARFLDHNAGAMTRLIDQLEDKGYVRRKPHAQDRRALTIELTPAGQDLWRAMSQYMERAQELAMQDLKAPDRTKLFELLKRVRDTLDQTP
ncbi:MAG: MarR family transcriptional regulator [Rudaea sp.]|uniref:MarR family winged helix-turn-helix transcriptional regulator n=1 Tax=unclassified Rudaea TaxID=2627037 RepID=UPI0010F6A17A|nr:MULTISPECIES: MarR family transcriptional regulator [unclassified Rudaea]MBN8888102.1 MarR family transcriptional regulator [Rudaea sp.]MBR0345035.1 MarR family transcriptional regulator [Rudaea sp.]